VKVSPKLLINKKGVEDIEGIIREIINGIPKEWETHFCADIMIEILTSRVQNLIK